MNLHLIPKNTPVYIYRIHGVSTYSLNKNSLYNPYTSDQEAFIDLDNPDVDYHNPPEGIWYRFMVDNVELGVDKIHLVKL